MPAFSQLAGHYFPLTVAEGDRIYLSSLAASRMGKSFYLGLNHH